MAKRKSAHCSKEPKCMMPKEKSCACNCSSCHNANYDEWKVKHDTLSQLPNYHKVDFVIFVDGSKYLADSKDMTWEAVCGLRLRLMEEGTWQKFPLKQDV